MTANVLLVVYLAMGLGAAVFVVVERSSIAGQTGLRGALVMLFLWPFLLPVELFGEGTLGAKGGPGRRAEQIRALAARAKSAFEGLPDSGVRRTRELAILDEFVERLLLADRRVSEVELAERDAPPSVRARLAELRQGAERELDGDLKVLEELVAQTTLLRFSDLRGNQDKSRVEDLLLRIEGQNQVAVVLDRRAG